MAKTLFTQPDVSRLVDSLLCLSSRAEAGAYLRDLLTEDEIKEFSRRLTAAALLQTKTPYTTITQQTGLSSTTIARISKWLNGSLGGYRTVLERLAHTNPSHR